MRNTKCYSSQSTTIYIYGMKIVLSMIIKKKARHNKKKLFLYVAIYRKIWHI